MATDELRQRLIRPGNRTAAESVHLAEWPAQRQTAPEVDEPLLEQMDVARAVAEAPWRSFFAPAAEHTWDSQLAEPAIPQLSNSADEVTLSPTRETHPLNRPSWEADHRGGKGRSPKGGPGGGAPPAGVWGLDPREQ